MNQDDSIQKDVRWQQRFVNFNKALKQLENAIGKEELSSLAEEGLIWRFERTYELAWKTLQDLLLDKGYEGIHGPKAVIQQCFQVGIITDGEGWVRMHKCRDLTPHTYNKETAKEIVELIQEEFFNLLHALQAALEKEKTSLMRMGLEALTALESSKRLAALGGSEKQLENTPRRKF